MLKLNNFTYFCHLTNSERPIPNFELSVSEKVYCKGPSGSGKSSFLKAVFGIHAPKDHTLLIEEQSIKKTNMNLLRLKMKYLPQNIRWEDESIEAFISKASQLLFSNHLNTSFLNISLKKLLPDLDNQKKINHLSGGEKQTLFLCFLFSQKSPILILDESFSSMDHLLRKKTEDIFEEQLKEKIILFTHHFDDENFLSPNYILDFTHKNIQLKTC